MKRFFPAAAFCVFSLFGSASAQVVVGNPIVDRAAIDTAQTMFVLSSQGFGAQAIGHEVVSWSYYSGSIGLMLTPVLFEYTGSGNNYIVRGIGASVTTTLGAHLDLPFNVVSGSATIANANYFLGWKDGTPNTANVGSILLDYNSSSAGPDVLFVGSGVPSGIEVSDSFDFNGPLLERTYSISATAVAVPEPSTAVALVAIVALGFAVWRRSLGKV